MQHHASKNYLNQIQPVTGFKPDPVYDISQEYTEKQFFQDYTWAI